MRRLGRLAGIVLVVAALVSPASAQPPGPMGPGGGPGAGPAWGGGGGPWGWSVQERPIISVALMHARELGLTPEQEERLRSLRTEFEKESIRRAADIRAEELDLAALLEQPRWDLAQVEAKVKQIGQLQADLRMARIRTLDSGRAVLTPEQLRRVEQLPPWPAWGPGAPGPPRPRRPGVPSIPPAPGVPPPPRSP